MFVETSSAQTTPPRDSVARSVSADSLSARLARAEADIALLRQQVATESSTSVRLRSRLRLDLHARLLTNAFLTTADANNPEVPIFAKAPGGVSAEYGASGGRVLGLSIRQTTIGGSVSVDSVLGATFSSDVELDFFAGQTTDGPPLFPPPRLRTVRGFLRWERTELMIGADTPLMSDLDPVGVAAIGIPDFSAAGNLWNWLPQVRLTRDVGVLRAGHHAVHWAVQGALINPFSGDRHVDEVDGVDAGLRSARPSVEARLRAQWGREHDPTSSQRIGDRGGEIGLSAHRGWLRVSGDSLTVSRAVGADVRIGLSYGLELRGEAYQGRLLRGLGGGGIGQNFAPSSRGETLGDPLTDTAGWLQLNAQLRPTLMVGSGCGTDRVHNGQPSRQRNSACATHLEWRPSLPLLFGAEFRSIATRGPTGRYATRHFNLFFGIEL
ncbi:MAG: hypothetical protein IPP90_12175 [Gemmatimonadaceae bacterium]|nr:hypothetical protein [Gemmatimonadaceae bacterium]